MIRKKQIKYFKLILVSPCLERIIGFLYLIALPILIFNFLNTGYRNLTKLSSYEIHSEISKTFNEQELKNISCPQDLIVYIQDDILNKLYNIQINSEIPYFIPLGSVRLKKYSINNTLCHEISNADADYSCTGECHSEAIIELLKNNTDCFSYYTNDIENAVNTTISPEANSTSAFNFFVSP